MGGRGGSSGKSGGGLTNAQINNIAAKFTNPQPAQPVQQQTPPQAHKVIDQGEYSKFMSATDDQKADMITKMRKEDVPVFLADNDFQKLTYSISKSDKPQMVTDAALDKMKGKEIFRTVNSVRDTKNQISYDADMIASQVQRGKVTRVSDSGGSLYGRGIYFAGNYSSSISYGKANGSVKKTAVVRAKIDPKAKSIQYTPLHQQMKAEIQAKTKLGKAIARCDQASQISIYGLAKGYSVIESGHGYYNVLSRKALVMSDKIKSKSSSWK